MIPCHACKETVSLDVCADQAVILARTLRWAVKLGDLGVIKDERTLRYLVALADDLDLQILAKSSRATHLSLNG